MRTRLPAAFAAAVVIRCLAAAPAPAALLWVGVNIRVLGVAENGSAATFATMPTP